jgi:hypothetical protein
VSSAGGVRPGGTLTSESPSDQPDARRRKETDANLSPKQRYPRGADARIEGTPTASVSPSSVPSRERGVVKTSRERAEEKRQAKLELVREQLESGSLVIRKMTEEERRRYPPRPAQPKRLGRR